MINSNEERRRRYKIASILDRTPISHITDMVAVGIAENGRVVYKPVVKVTSDDFESLGTWGEVKRWEKPTISMGGGTGTAPSMASPRDMKAYLETRFDDGLKPTTPTTKRVVNYEMDKEGNWVKYETYTTTVAQRR
jgi:hypothetical protein